MIRKSQGRVLRLIHAPVNRPPTDEAMRCESSLIPDHFVEMVQQAKHILVFTGTAVASGNGRPEYHHRRSRLGFQLQPIFYKDFMESEDIRLIYWAQKLKDRDTHRGAYPNAVHKAIVKLEQADKLCMVVTQNVDGLQIWAGTSPAKLVEINGTNAEVECQSCRKRSDPHEHFEYFRKLHKAPRCDCGGLLKPATISFGQDLRDEDLQRAAKAAARTDMVISLGSSLSVYPASSIPLLAAQRRIPYVIIHQSRTHHDGHAAVSMRIDGDPLEIFPTAVSQALTPS